MFKSIVLHKLFYFSDLFNHLVLEIGSEAGLINIFINDVEKEVFTMKSPSLPMTPHSSG